MMIYTIEIYIKRNLKEWNSFKEQHKECKLVRTAKYAIGKWQIIPNPKPRRATVGNTES